MVTEKGALPDKDGQGAAALVPAPSVAVVALGERARAFADESRAESTRRAYATDWERFTTWAAPLGLPTLPSSPAAVGMHLAWLADEGMRVSTIERALAAIGYHHREGGFEWYPGHPDIARVLRGIRRRLGVARRKKAAMTDDVLASMLAHTTTWQRAALTLAFFGALRRSELASLTIEQVRFESRGLVVSLPRRKTDQEGAGTEIGIWLQTREDVCAVRAMRAWLDESQIREGRIFPRCSARTFARLVQRLAGKVGLDASRFGGHSPRAGFATTASAQGIDMQRWMRQTGHTSERVARGYVRPATLFDDNATKDLVK